MTKEYEYKSAGLKPISEGGDKEAMHRMIDGEDFYRVYEGGYLRIGMKSVGGGYQFMVYYPSGGAVPVEDSWNSVDQWLIRVEKPQRDWREHIGNGILCYVGDNQVDVDNKEFSLVVTVYNKHEKFSYKRNNCSVGWKLAVPMPEDEADKMIWRG